MPEERVFCTVQLILFQRGIVLPTPKSTEILFYGSETPNDHTPVYPNPSSARSAPVAPQCTYTLAPKWCCPPPPSLAPPVTM